MIMILTEQIMPKAMASYDQTQQGTAHTTLGGTHNSLNQTYGTSQGLPAHHGSQAITSPMFGVQYNTSMNPNAVRPTTFPPAPEYQLGYEVQVPNHGSAMAFSQPVRQQINTGQFHAPMPNVQHSGVNVSQGSYPAQHPSSSPDLGGQGYADFVYNPGQQFYVHSGSAVQQHSTMDVGGPDSSRHPNLHPAFGAQAYAAIPRSFMQVPNSVPRQNTLVDHSASNLYNRPYATRPQPPVTYHGSNETFSQPSELPTSWRYTSHNLLVSGEVYTGQQSGVAHNEAYLAARNHSGRGQLRPRPREGQQEPLLRTASIDSSTEVMQQGQQHHHANNGSPTEDTLEPQLESPTSDNRNATIPAETGESISSAEQSSSLIEATAQIQPPMNEPFSTPSDILEDDKLDAPPDVDEEVPDGSNPSSAQDLGICETPDELSLEFSRFIDRLYPELIFPHDPPAAAFDEENMKTWEMLSRV